ncbi:unnamed protein product [marine sediment metagenome]|uniref:Uncharacterized protein n=1 Tax=marine sediment metagenome TaxID=412755 RepID=X0TC71_9ZZZZ
MSFSYKQVLANPPIPKIVAKAIPKTSPQDLSRLKDYYNEKEVFEARERNIKVLQESRLLQWIFFAIDNNYLIHISITSEEIGKLEGLGMEYGSGKSNLALMIMYVTYKILYEREGYLINDYESTTRLEHRFRKLFLPR